MEKFTIPKDCLKQDGEKLIRQALLPKTYIPVDIDTEENLIELENYKTGMRLWCPVHELFKMPIAIGRTVGMVDYKSITNISQKALATTDYVLKEIAVLEFRKRDYLQAIFVPAVKEAAVSHG